MRCYWCGKFIRAGKEEYYQPPWAGDPDQTEPFDEVPVHKGECPNSHKRNQEGANKWRTMQTVESTLQRRTE